MSSRKLHAAMQAVLGNIPHNVIVRLGKLLGVGLYVLDIPHKRLVKRNLSFCYPEAHKDELRELSKRIFESFGIVVFEILQSSFISKQNILRIFQVRGEEHLIRALEGGRGVIIISSHMGNWELAPQFVCCHFGRPLTGVARRLRSRWMDLWFHHMRTRFGNKLIYKKGALPKMVETLRNGELLGFTMDQSRRKQGVSVSFFGREATTTPAAALLAIRCKSPVLPAFCVREADGGLTVHVKPPLELKRTGDLRSDLQTNTQVMMDALEDMIRKYPDQWVWFQRPWKRAHPELYPEWEARRQKRKRMKKKKRAASEMAAS
ncbi:MAG: lysophospholipid acyltransferase family protein [Planctomycetota bacterium]|jgi:KDO2-lipid IV(A) lauroyltransferase